MKIKFTIFQTENNNWIGRIGGVNSRFFGKDYDAALAWCNKWMFE